MSDIASVTQGQTLRDGTPLKLRPPAFEPLTLQVLFGGAEKPRARKPLARVMEKEERRYG